MDRIGLYKRTTTNCDSICVVRGRNIHGRTALQCDNHSGDEHSESRLTSSEISGGRNALEQVLLRVVPCSPTGHNPTTPPASSNTARQLCDSSDQAVHCRNLGPELGD